MVTVVQYYLNRVSNTVCIIMFGQSLKKRKNIGGEKMDAIPCRKIGFNKEFVVGFTQLLFEEKMQKTAETAKEKELIVA